MSVFTDSELEYLAGQRLGRIATVGADGQPHVVPTSFRYNAEHDAIDIGGMRMSQTKKLRDVQRTGRASIVVDDVLPPWQPRMVEIRGTATVISSGGKAFGEQFEDKEHELFGKDGFEGVVAQVATLEDTLGVADLNQFTPNT